MLRFLEGANFGVRKSGDFQQLPVLVDTRFCDSLSRRRFLEPTSRDDSVRMQLLVALEFVPRKQVGVERVEKLSLQCYVIRAADLREGFPRIGTTKTSSFHMTTARQVSSPPKAPFIKPNSGNPEALLVKRGRSGRPSCAGPPGPRCRCRHGHRHSFQQR